MWQEGEAGKEARWERRSGLEGSKRLPGLSLPAYTGRTSNHPMKQSSNSGVGLYRLNVLLNKLCFTCGTQLPSSLPYFFRPNARGCNLPSHAVSCKGDSKYQSSTEAALASTTTHDIVDAQFGPWRRSRECQPISRGWAVVAQLVIGGLGKIDLEDWQKHTRLKHCTADTPVVQWFWRTVEGYSEERRARLLQFVTGSSRVPLQGFRALQGKCASRTPSLAFWFLD